LESWEAAGTESVVSGEVGVVEVDGAAASSTAASVETDETERRTRAARADRRMLDTVHQPVDFAGRRNWGRGEPRQW
jgi:hypothetical protein